MLKSKKEREWDQNNQQVGDEELICAAKPEPNYCSGTGTTGVYISKECLNHQAHYLWSNEYIIVYSKWNRSNRRKTHLSKARHSSQTNPCYTSGRGGMSIPFSHTLDKCFYDDCESFSFHFTYFPQESLWKIPNFCQYAVEVKKKQKKIPQKSWWHNISHPTLTLPPVIYSQR